MGALFKRWTGLLPSTSVEEDAHNVDWDGEGGNTLDNDVVVSSVIMLGSSGSVVIVVISGTMIVFAGGTSVSIFNLKVLGSSVVVVVVSGGTVVVTIASGKTVLVMGGNCVSNFEPKGSAQLVSLSDNFLFTMSSKGVERSSITSPDNSQII